jgi:hypothetical protein
MGMIFKHFQRLRSEERGSISVITIGLFLITLTTCLILTNISSIYLAKRSLSLATEAALQRGMKNLDEAAYYSGEYNLTQLLHNSLGGGESDPGIPINCESGYQDIQEVLQGWQSRGAASVRENVDGLRLTNFECDGFQIYIESAGIVRIPIRIPFINIDEVAIHSFAGAIGERAETNNYYGFDIG